MLTLTPNTRIFLATDPINMRGSFDALAGRIRALGLQPLDGALYVFVSKRRHLMAVLSFDGSAWCLFKKRLVKGTFQMPPFQQGQTRIPVDTRTLTSILAGIDIHAEKRRWFEAPHAARP